MTTPAMLELSGVTIKFGGLTAVAGLDLQVAKDSITALIGPNGAGKTTVFNMVTGVYTPGEGSISLDGEPLRRGRPHVITRQGIARTFQNIRLFDNMTSRENVLVGVHSRHKTNVAGAVFGLPRYRREEREGQQRAAELLEFVGVAHRADDVARNLPYGDQRRLEIARALGTEPRLLLLDEPAAGMNQSEKASLAELVGKIRDSGVTVLLIEHDMGLVMKVSDRVAVLDFGEKIAEGAPAEVQRDPAVIRAYLGSP